jgi:hypothetical protein
MSESVKKEETVVRKKQLGKKGWLKQPGDCDMKVYEDGVGVYMLAGGCSQAIEALVMRCASDLGIKADWNYVGGRAVVHVLGTEEQQKAVVAWLDIHHKIQGASL